MNTVEAHQTGLTEQLQTNTQKTSTHLSEVNASLNSITQSLDQARQSLSNRLAKQEEIGQTLNQTVQQFQQLKRDTKAKYNKCNPPGKSQTNSPDRRTHWFTIKRFGDSSIRTGG